MGTFGSPKFPKMWFGFSRFGAVFVQTVEYTLIILSDSV